MRDLLVGAARRLVQNAHYKVLAVLIAVGAWWYVQASDLDRTSLRVGVVWLEPDGLVTTEPLPQSVLLTVDGSRNALRPGLGAREPREPVASRDTARPLADGPPANSPGSSPYSSSSHKPRGRRSSSMRRRR